MTTVFSKHSNLPNTTDEPQASAKTSEFDKLDLDLIDKIKTAITTLYNVCAVPWGCSVPWGVFSTVGDIMSTVGGYLEYRGGCSVPWGDIMINVGDILSTVEGVQYRGGIS